MLFLSFFAVDFGQSAFTAHHGSHFLDALDGEGGICQRLHGDGHEFHGVIICQYPVGTDFAATAAAVIVFAIIIGLTDVSDGVIRIVNQIIKIGAIFLGVRAIVPRGSEDGVRKGALLGLIYMGVGVLIYALLSGQKLTLMGYTIDLLMGLAAGGLSGMILGSMSRK